MASIALVMVLCFGINFIRVLPFDMLAIALVMVLCFGIDFIHEIYQAGQG